MKIQYVANDGTIFNNENDCKKYEDNNKFKGCLFYNDELELVPLTKDTVVDIYYAHFETLKQFEEFKAFNEECGIDTEELNNINTLFKLDFYYDTGFRQYDVEVNNLITKIDKLQKEKIKLFYD